VDRSLIIHPKSRQVAERPEVRLSRWLLQDPAETEQFRVLCARMRRITGEGNRPPARVVAVTSATEGEGKTLSSVNLAATLARDFLHRVLLIEADLRRPTLSRRQPSLLGLVECAKGSISVEDALCTTEVPNLMTLVAGRTEGERSTHFLGSAAFRQQLVKMRERFDHIVVDCPPLLPAADMGLVVEWVDHLLLVIRADVTDRSLVLRALEGGFRERVAGVILNGVSKFGEGYRGYSY
jgi:capsular exopolysaccharide synthesis family protein